jgi:transcriptional regulator with XRE-family HTH domain
MDISEQLQYVIDQIKKFRVRQGISQIELSLRANLSQSFLANLENGKKQPSVLTIIKIASALEVNPKEFFPQKATTMGKQQIKEEIINLLEYL